MMKKRQIQSSNKKFFIYMISWEFHSYFRFSRYILKFDRKILKRKHLHSISCT